MTDDIKISLKDCSELPKFYYKKMVRKSIIMKNFLIVLNKFRKLKIIKFLKLLQNFKIERLLQKSIGGILRIK